VSFLPRIFLMSLLAVAAPDASAQGRVSAETPPSAGTPTSAETPLVQPSSPHQVPEPASLEPPRIPVRGIEVPGAKNTILIAAPGPAENIARGFAGTLTEERDALHRLLGLPDGGPLEIRVGHGHEEFRALQPSRALAPGWAAGVAYPRLGLIVLDSQAAARGGDIRSLLRHELAHVALARVVTVPIPSWFTEGFALLYADEWTLSRSTILARASVSKSLIPLRDLERGWPSSPSEVDLAYAQSASIVTWLAAVDGGRPFRELIASMSGGASFHDSIKTAYGQPLIVHEIAWKETLSNRYGWLPLFFDSQLMWAWAALILVLGAWRVRRRSKRRLDTMEDGPDLEAQHHQLLEIQRQAAEGWPTSSTVSTDFSSRTRSTADEPGDEDDDDPGETDPRLRYH